MFKDHTLWAVIQAGGFIMYFLIFCSILSITVIIERLVYYWKKSRMEREVFMELIHPELEKGDVQKVLMLCKGMQTPFSAVIYAGLSNRDKSEKEIANAMEREMIKEVHLLERYTDIAGTLGSTAVYIGLLGTVWGIIRAFEDIARTGSGGINVVIRGISEALVCTAGGLIVAVPAVIAYNYFVKRINSFVTDMELSSSEMMDLLRKK